MLSVADAIVDPGANGAVFERASFGRAFPDFTSEAEQALLASSESGLPDGAVGAEVDPPLRAVAVACAHEPREEVPALDSLDDDDWRSRVLPYLGLYFDSGYRVGRLYLNDPLPARSWPDRDAKVAKAAQILDRLHGIADLDQPGLDDIGLTDLMIRAVDPDGEAVLMLKAMGMESPGGLCSWSVAMGFFGSIADWEIRSGLV